MAYCLGDDLTFYSKISFYIALHCSRFYPTSQALKKRLQERLKQKEESLTQLFEQQLNDELSTCASTTAAKLRRVAIKHKHMVEMQQFRFAKFLSFFFSFLLFSTSLWPNHFPVLSVFSHVSFHFIFFISSRVLLRYLRLGRPLLLFLDASTPIVFLERLSLSLLLMCPYQFNLFCSQES